MKLNITHQLGLMLVFLFVGSMAFAQSPNLNTAQQYLNSQAEEWGLSQQDIAEPIVTDEVTDRKTGITRVYMQQQYQGIPVYNAVSNYNINSNGEVYSAHHSFVQGLAGKVNTTIPIINAEEAIKKLANHLGLQAEGIRLIEEVAQSFVFEKGNLAKEDIKVHLALQPVGNSVRLVWDVTLFPVASADMWSTRVDAVTGEIAHEHNWTVYCSISTDTYRHAHHDCGHAHHNHSAVAPPVVAGESYNVWPIPYESPNHGPRTIVTDPHDPEASPFAWHDTDGEDGAEYTITRGNNVHAFEDSDADDQSAGNEPDGGADLVFDFPYNSDWEPFQYMDAAVVNLFYFNNIMHDMAYHYGMDGPAGAFQDNNYGQGGLGNDHVNAHAQDGGGTNNANFGTPPDGSSGQMQMFLWGAGGTRFLRVESPASIAGEYETGLPIDFGAGATPSTDPVTAEVVIVEDGVEEPFASDACEPLTNGGELNGKIALIDRGGCEFGAKALAAQDEGAVGVIICNFEDATINMGAGAVGAQVQIPTVFISSVSCQTIRQFVGNGLEVTLQEPDNSGPSQLDGDLDNGIIAHEYGHGISNRLTGGPGAAGCLFGNEQMGEGWSDFMTLVTSVQDGDDGTMKRGVGTYATSEPTSGTGIRTYAYSTDMDINPHTYGDLPSESIPHGVGSVWCAMLWEMYWNFVDEYGWSDDLFTGTAGNNMAIRLVFEGMKNQPCGPGFVTGRDAILEADEQLYGGANQCLIWKAFAKRGCGLSADQGSADQVGDETIAFDIPCTCADEVSITKSVTPFILPGDDVEVTLDVSNCRTIDVTGVTVTDEIPDGLSFVAGSSSIPADVSGSTISFDLGDLASEATASITFTLSSDPSKASTRIFLDDVPDDNEDNWLYNFIGNQATNLFQLTDVFGGVDDDWVWYVEGIETESRQELVLNTDEVTLQIDADRPTLRFYHRYNTEPAADGGVVDVRELGTTTWKQIQDSPIRNGYPSGIQYGTFVVPNLLAFSGFSGDNYEASYFDLSEFAGQEVEMRFRFGTDDNTTVADAGWWIDNIEYMDLLSYNGEACITTAEGDNNCVIAPEEGTIVESAFPSNATVRELEDVTLVTFPNPTTSMLNVNVQTERLMDLEVRLLNVDGKEIMNRTTTANGNRHIMFNVSEVPAGFYFIQVSSEDGILTNKVIIE